MTDSDTNFTPTDFRRASCLLLHAADHNVAGVQAVWLEAAQAGAWPDLTAALLALVLDLSPDLKTPEGLDGLRELTRSLVAAEAAS